MYPGMFVLSFPHLANNLPNSSSLKMKTSTAKNKTFPNLPNVHPEKLFWQEIILYLER